VALPGECAHVLTFVLCRNEEFCEGEWGWREGGGGGRSMHVLFGDGSVGQTVLVLSRFFAFFLWAGQDDGVVMIFCGGGRGG
jgi:prepilin-type processing-associated H-X9-DG protein